MVELEGTDKYPAELTGGMRQAGGHRAGDRPQPRYILYDEPTTGLDPVTSAVMDQLMIRTRDLGVTGLVVTHDMRSAFTVGDRIAMLHEGAIRQVGTVAEIQATDDPVVRQFIEGGRVDAPAPAGRSVVKRSNEFAVGLAVLGARPGDRRRALAERDRRQPEGGHLHRALPDGRRTRRRAGHAAGRRVGRVEAIRLAEDEWVETEFSIDRDGGAAPSRR